MTGATSGPGPVILGGLLAWVSAWGAIVLKAHLDRAADHRKWSLDKAADLYEEVLMAVSSWQAEGDQVTRAHRWSSPDEEIPVPDAPGLRRLEVRLRMLGDRDVREAFKRYTEARGQWLGWHGRVRDAQKANSQVAHGEMPTITQVPPEELTVLRAHRDTAAQAAETRAEELAERIDTALGPDPRRRWPLL